MWLPVKQPSGKASALFETEGFLFSAATLVDPATVQAYRETDYRVLVTGLEFTLRVDQQSHALLDLHKAHGVRSSAFITACNPFSQMLGDEANRQLQAELAIALSHADLTWIAGEGKHPTGNWPAEPSYLVLGIDLDHSKGLGNRFEQNALIWSDVDAIPRLVLLR